MTPATLGSKKMEFCDEDAVQGMVNLYSKNCNHPGCDKIPSFGVEGSRKRKFCAEHAVYQG
ncbi:unnamed protein product [Ectocarpus sp. 8 AP-2014]